MPRILAQADLSSRTVDLIFSNVLSMGKLPFSFNPRHWLDSLIIPLIMPPRQQRETSIPYSGIARRNNGKCNNSQQHK